MGIMLSIYGPTAQIASLLSHLAYLMPWEPRESLWVSYYHVLSRAYAPSKSGRNRSSRASPKVDSRMWCWYSGAKSWPELLTWAYSPPMGVYRTAIVQGLSSTHGPEGGRKNRQSFWTFNAVTLKDKLETWQKLRHVKLVRVIISED